VGGLPTPTQPSRPRWASRGHSHWVRDLWEVTSSCGHVLLIPHIHPRFARSVDAASSPGFLGPFLRDCWVGCPVGGPRPPETVRARATPLRGRARCGFLTRAASLRPETRRWKPRKGGHDAFQARAPSEIPGVIPFMARFVRFRAFLAAEVHVRTFEGATSVAELGAVEMTESNSDGVTTSPARLRAMPDGPGCSRLSEERARRNCHSC
jgi:hypothetical protein